ncbi:hypothetical protein [Sanguibacter sp. HDW7]|uniref:hypothetical protein n=1 Tax=Sanguibacter sp. HDW7 TaxID=2714931 RepID=UPI00140B72EC|nr:hypothetical protein [Sanguibacter sp. HDW7]QIK83171.1 hypothetical protein G7063_05650 [Sanguibacter sp. HDW7]
MTDAPHTRPQPGDEIHGVRSGLTLSTSTEPIGGPPPITLRRGQTLTLTEPMIAASIDRLGGSWLDLIDDEPAQIARWGQRMFARGPAPEGLTSWEPGTPEHTEARERARREAWALPESRRWDALRRVETDYGPPQATNSITARYPGGRA